MFNSFPSQIVRKVSEKQKVVVNEYFSNKYYRIHFIKYNSHSVALRLAVNTKSSYEKYKLQLTKANNVIIIVDN